MPDSIDATLKEFESLRAEIAAHQRTKTQYLTLAITATGAIGSFALGRNGNRDALLVLPLVLSGLMIVYLRHNVDIELIGQYVRQELWPYISEEIEVHDRADSGAEISSPKRSMPSWDEWIQQRRVELRRGSVYGAMGIAPQLLVFAAPGLGALVISFSQIRDSEPLSFVWILDIVVMLVSFGFLVWSLSAAPGWKQDPKRNDR